MLPSGLKGFDSNLGRDTHNPEVLRGFHQSSMQMQGKYPNQTATSVVNVDVKYGLKLKKKLNSMV
jgi:hypothetical protein